MKICPKCGKENPDDAKICQYCGAKLDLTEKDFEWVLLMVARNQFEADVVKDLLESNDVDVMVKRAAAGIAGGNMLGNPLMGSSGAWSIYVMNMDLEKAKQLLNAEEEPDGTHKDNDEGA